MPPQVRLPLFLTLLINLYPASTAPLESPDPPRYSAPEDAWTSPPELDAPWLDEVRAQRKAWEARRNAARQDYETRRRLINPRGSARQEAWEEDLRRRRAQRQERIDKERERFRSLRPGQPAPARPEDSSALGAEPPAADYPPQGDPLLAPPGWNNLWYFRGF